MSENPPPCEHRLCFKGTHPSFPKGLWVCAECEEHVDLGTLEDYGVVLAAARIDALRELKLEGMCL